MSEGIQGGKPDIMNTKSEAILNPEVRFDANVISGTSLGPYIHRRTEGPGLMTRDTWYFFNFSLWGEPGRARLDASMPL